MLTLEELAGLHARHAKAANARVAEFSLGNRQFDFNTRPFVMGVINLSPDSWYRESVCLSAEAAHRHCSDQYNPASWSRDSSPSRGWSDRLSACQ